jgi:hypothetical protein
VNLRPVDLPRLRTDAIDFARTDAATAYERAIRDGRQIMRPDGGPAAAAAKLAGAEAKRLTGADLYYVSAPMTDLAVAAGNSLPEFNLMPEDLPTPCGFMYFDKPMATVDYNDYRERETVSDIVAVSWGPWRPWTPGHLWSDGGIWMTFWADYRGIIDNAQARGILTHLPARFVAGVPRLCIDNECQSPFTREPIATLVGGEVTAFEDAKGVGRWMAIIKTTWLLMQQQVTDVTDAEYDRAARRRLQKQGIEPPTVRVINLRRVAHSAGTGESDRERHHTWIVRGHWRNQWYPSRGVNRPIWIAPHLKGPEGLPLLGGEKVHAWTR